jgi:hypothetical protein
MVASLSGNQGNCQNCQSNHSKQRTKLRTTQLFAEHLNQTAEKLTTESLITVDSATTPLQNGACTYRCISKQMHYKTLFSHNGYMKSLEFDENYITLVARKKQTF